MGTINDKLTYLNNTKTAIKNEMIAEGITVTENDTFRSYPTKMAAKNTEIQNAINTQDTLLSAQETKIEQLETALDNKIALDLCEFFENEVQAGNSARSGICLSIKKLPDNFFTPTVQDVQHLFSWCMFENAPMIDTSNIMYFQRCFSNCRKLKTAPQYSFSKAYHISSMFESCVSLKNVPIYDWSNLKGMMMNVFYNCSSLSSESLNNIMASCITATNYTGTKTLAYIGLSQTQATTCQTLSNWDAFVEAGWTTRLLERRNKLCQVEQINKE